MQQFLCIQMNIDTSRDVILLEIVNVYTFPILACSMIRRSNRFSSLANTEMFIF